MKRLLMLLLLAALVPAPVLGQVADPPAKKAAKVKFDLATVVSVTGTVLGERRTDHGKGTKSVHLIMKVGEDQVSVHLGPDSWVDRQVIKFAKGDQVTVKGSKFNYEGKYGLIAQSVTRGGDNLVIRDSAGKTAWAGSGAKLGTK